MKTILPTIKHCVSELQLSATAEVQARPLRIQSTQSCSHLMAFAHAVPRSHSPGTPRLIISVSHHFLDKAWLILVLMTFYDVSCEKNSNSLIRLSIYSLHWDRRC